MRERYVFMMFGYVGAGKSYTAEWLAEAMQAVHLRADDIRVAMFEKDRPELHTPQNKALVNNALYYCAEQILDADVANVVFDANFNQRRVRQKISGLARTYGAQPIIVWVKTPEDIARQRIKARAESGGHVIFHPDIITAMRKTTDLPSDDEPLISIDGLQNAQEQRRSFEQQLLLLSNHRHD